MTFLEIFRDKKRLGYYPIRDKADAMVMKHMSLAIMLRIACVFAWLGAGLAAIIDYTFFRKDDPQC